MKISPLIHSASLAAASIIVSGLAFVNSAVYGAPTERATPQAKIPSKEAIKAAALRSLVTRLINEGFEEEALRNLRGDLDIPLDVPTRGNDAVAKEMSDGMDNRECILVLVKDSGESPRGKHLVFKARRLTGQDSETHFFRTSPEGVLEKVFVLRGKYDDQGKPVRGSAVVTSLDIDSPDVKARLQRELDFWLYGKGRKQAKPAGKVPAASAEKASAQGKSAQ